MKMSVIIPMYNESKVIGASAKELSNYMQKTFAEYELIFVSDGSTDGCDKVVEELNLPNTKVIAYTPNQGKGYAVRTGMLASTGDYCMFTDADLAYGTEVIKKVADTFEQNPQSDLVIGSRNLDKDGYAEYSFLRKVASKVYIKVLCIAGGFKLSDSQCGCKAYSKKAVQEIFPRCTVNRFAFDFETILWAQKLNLAIAEMPVKVIHHGDSKVRVIHDTFQMLKDLRKMKKRIKKAQI